MKKINNIRQLQMEQERLKIKQAYIEATFINNWSRFKKNLSIKNLAKESIYSLISTKPPPPKEVTGLIKGGLYLGAILLFRKWRKN